MIAEEIRLTSRHRTYTVGMPDGGGGGGGGASTSSQGRPHCHVHCSSGSQAPAMYACTEHSVHARKRSFQSPSRSSHQSHPEATDTPISQAMVNPKGVTSGQVVTRRSPDPRLAENCPMADKQKRDQTQPQEEEQGKGVSVSCWLHVHCLLSRRLGG
ncbi:hypothetical protein GE21DRAFT_4345 [Neurospora crassa]|uniref:Uncharacterized protein n=1 Tax=Neurospora crassa (strain ATCC 24698 / 74-OR23-1A / CBS 708.71 / DSM 1257 / FGSC 987) TaxID=367110 RepID=Q7RX81_NEUCR|nr:hypothetical protein NCU00069 [Neurospora crassa OR74A]EAA27143.2 hypothetical protein NCU00069 [Neurospora crassa OR74A]KHE79647.1 hypothetical protein GE21DRAFT_4345 [Neurospora crassa]|eukprot:XP_956379.2 hypothetical protein NCU00069 [Neurospora crassa OR74A]